MIKMVVYHVIIKEKIKRIAFSVMKMFIIKLLKQSLGNFPMFFIQKKLNLNVWIVIRKWRLILKFAKIVIVNLFILRGILKAECEKCHPKAIGDSLSSSPHFILKCSECHINFDKFPHPEGKVKASCKLCHPDVVRNFEKSVHFGKVDCYECHGKHRTLSFKIHGAKLLIEEKCAYCHGKEVKDYEESIHFKALKKGIKDAPSCIDCHLEHKILSPLSPESPVYPLKIPETCAKCHENTRITSLYGIPPRRFASYRKSYHGIFLYKGEVHAANCVSCHEYHKILPSDDPRSSVYPDSLVKTCSKCHKERDWKLTEGKIHVEAKKEVSPGVYAVRVFYISFISFLTFMFLFHIILDLRRRKK